MKKILLSTVILICLLLFGTACGESSDPPAETTTEASLVVFLTEGRSDYTIVYPADFEEDSDGFLAVEELKTLLETNAGSPFSLSTDYSADGYTPSAALEILLGETNREETALAMAGLREEDYVIQVINDKLVVVGGSKAASAKAIKRFGAMFFSQTQQSLILKENYVYAYKHDYPLNELTLGDKTLADYVIAYDSDFRSDASRLQSTLLRLTGYRLPVQNASDTSDSQCRILLTGTEGQGFSASFSNTTLTLSGDSNGNMALAVSRFIKKLEESGKSAAIDSSFAIDTTLSDNVKFTVFDLNLYSTGYAENSVNNRYPRLMKLLETYKPAILTLQDVSPTWLTNMKNGQENVSALTDTYDYVGTGRNNDEDSVMQAIFYDKSLFTLKDSGTFWLSETPDWESVGWDGRTRTICTWAILTEKVSGKDFVVMNTQLDPYGKNAQRNGAALIAERAASFGLPVILGGDLQTTTSSPAFSQLTGTVFQNTMSIASTVGERGKTVNEAFGNDQTNFTSASDFILTSYGDFRVESYTLIKDKVEDLFVSNHWPILCHVVIDQ